jgi:integrase
LRVAYIIGWRPRELLTRRWEHVDFKRGCLRLEPGETKNGDGRETPFTPEVREVLEKQAELAGELEKRSGVPVDQVFFRDNGKPIGSYCSVWRAACKRAGLEGKLFYDTRRTAVRNFELAGVSRSVAMSFTGHRTENVYRRYAIADKRAQREAALKIAALHASEDRSRSRLTPGEIERLAKKAEGTGAAKEAASQ